MAAARTLFGYPLTLTASVEVGDRTVDLDAAFRFDAHSPTGLYLNTDVALALISTAQQQRAIELSTRTAEVQPGLLVGPTDGVGLPD